MRELEEKIVKVIGLYKEKKQAVFVSYVNGFGIICFDKLSEIRTESYRKKNMIIIDEAYDFIEQMMDNEDILVRMKTVWSVEFAFRLDTYMEIRMYKKIAKEDRNVGIRLLSKAYLALKNRINRYEVIDKIKEKIDIIKEPKLKFKLTTYVNWKEYIVKVMF